jgi:hypothetical protein
MLTASITEALKYAAAPARPVRGSKPSWRPASPPMAISLNVLLGTWVRIPFGMIPPIRSAAAAPKMKNRAFI